MTPPDIAAIARGLSETCRKALPYLDMDEARSPYDLKVAGMRGGFTTLETLARRGLIVECGDHHGRFYSPHTTYEYRLTPLGLAVRDHLLSGKQA